VRVVVVGASREAVVMARLLIDRGHELILVDEDRERIDELTDDLDCGFLHGDGTRPTILQEADPTGSDLLFCLTGQDQVNILSALVGRSLGFGTVITSVLDQDFEELCEELGLENTIVPERTIGRYLADLVEGVDVLELRTVVKGEARFFAFAAGPDEEGRVDELELPEDARVVCLYREEELVLADPDVDIREEDEVVILTHSRHLAELRERWDPEVAGDAGGEEEGEGDG
jgi:trk system potassium uptake protein TrkA